MSTLLTLTSALGSGLNEKGLPHHDRQHYTIRYSHYHGQQLCNWDVLAVTQVMPPLDLSIPEPRAAHLALQCLLHIEGGEQQNLVVRHVDVELLHVELALGFFVLS